MTEDLSSGYSSSLLSFFHSGRFGFGFGVTHAKSLVLLTTGVSSLLMSLRRKAWEAEEGMWESQRYRNGGKPEIGGFPKAKLGESRRVGRRKWGRDARLEDARRKRKTRDASMETRGKEEGDARREHGGARGERRGRTEGGRREGEVPSGRWGEGFALGFGGALAVPTGTSACPGGELRVGSVAIHWRRRSDIAAPWGEGFARIFGGALAVPTGTSACPGESFAWFLWRFIGDGDRISPLLGGLRGEIRVLLRR